MENPHSRRRLCFDRRTAETGCGTASAQGYARCIRARCRKSLIRCITRLLTVTQELTRTRCRKVCTVLLRFCLFKRKTHPRAMQESPQMQMFANIGSVRRTRVQGTKGSAHVLPAWRRARSEPDLRKAARKAARRAQDCAKRRRRKCARASMRRIMWNIKIYYSPGERAFLLQKTILCMKITQK